MRSTINGGRTSRGSLGSRGSTSDSTRSSIASSRSSVSSEAARGSVTSSVDLEAKNAHIYQVNYKIVYSFMVTAIPIKLQLFTCILFFETKTTLYFYPQDPPRRLSSLSREQMPKSCLKNRTNTNVVTSTMTVAAKDPDPTGADTTVVGKKKELTVFQHPDVPFLQISIESSLHRDRPAAGEAVSGGLTVDRQAGKGHKLSVR